MRTLALLFVILLLAVATPALLLLDVTEPYVALHWTSLLVHLAVAAVIYLVLAIVGFSLDAKFTATVQAFMDGRSADLAPPKRLVQTFGLLLLALLPYLIFLLLFSLFAATAFSFYGFWAVSQLPRVPVVILFALIGVVFGTAIGFLSGIFRLIFPPKPRIVGIDLQRSRQPEIWRIADEVASSVGTKPVDRIVLTADPGVSVHLSGPLPLTLCGGGRRVLQLGLPSLNKLTVSELRAILAHEYGHFSNRDTQWSAFTYAMGNGLTAAFRATPGPLQRADDGGGGFYRIILALNPAYWTLLLFLNLFSAVTSAFSRVGEVMADVRAMKLYGGEPFARGLWKVAFNDVVFARAVQEEIVPSLLKDDKIVANFALLMRGVTDRLTEEQRKEIDDIIASAKADAHDSHPTMATRLSYAARFSSSRSTADPRDVSTLFTDWDAMNNEIADLYCARLFAFLRAIAARQVSHAGAAASAGVEEIELG